MRPMKTLLGIALGVLGAAAAQAQDLRFMEPAARAALSPGELVEVRWERASQPVEELEFLLSLDDGRHYSVRLTPEMAGASDAFVWRVPSLPGRAARLAIRANVGGRERIVSESGRFEILPENEPHAEARLPVRERDGELWADGGILEGDPQLPRGVGASRTPGMSDAVSEVTALDPRPEAALAGLGRAFAPVIDGRSRTIRPWVSHPLDRTPRSSPLRN